MGDNRGEGEGINGQNTATCTPARWYSQTTEIALLAVLQLSSTAILTSI
jgi:hypothetical protein